ncbi:RNA methyltransferase [Gloeobacter violaceus]|uniref:tRNA (cytidine/uridine-2'-O-)-methyltransferase TrmJ n=1 Tax=Gloeobacter violaceus (strain ATCC 29082 / PCC 7421) TaxID=251221 RepID=Q7NIP3_GLOVI|nr:RNA methyltransferase [Gloeobacter violaceus]BAC90081.1 glr2140 [Gloeobacter violaceus PCC 7421]
MNVRIVLVATQGARNLGAIARVIKNFDLSELWLVAPECSPKDEEARHMAVHAADVLDQARIVASLSQALADCTRVAGTTARTRTVSDPPLLPAEGARWLRADKGTAAYVFGPEDRGLSNEELAHCQRTVQIPTGAAYPSLNLAQAVGICAYALFTDSKPPSPVFQNEPMPEAEVLEGFYGHLERTLLAIGYLQEHTAERKLEKFRRLFNRAGLTAQEVALLRGVLRQIDWASTQNPARQLPLTPDT